MQLYQITVTGVQTTENLSKALRLIANAIDKVKSPVDANEITGGEYNDCCTMLELTPIS